MSACSYSWSELARKPLMPARWRMPPTITDQILEAADGSEARLRPPGDEPGPRQREQRGQQFAAMLENVFLQALVLEPGALERLRALRVHANPVAAPRHVAAQLDIVAGDDPGAPDGQVDRLRLAQDAVAVGGLGQRLAEIARSPGGN